MPERVMRFRGSTDNIFEIRWRAPSDRYDGSVYTPPLIFRKRFGTLSSSNGRWLHSAV